jgi:hypothetical protein
MLARQNTQSENTDYYNLFMKAAKSGGLYVGMFKEEAASTFLQQLEHAAYNFFLEIHQCIVAHGYDSNEYDYVLGQLLDLILKWPAETQKAECSKIKKKYPGIKSLYKASCTIYSRDIYRQMNSVKQITLRLPKFKVFLYCFLTRLVTDPFVRTRDYFRGSKIIERKLVHMDALRYAMEKCVRVNVSTNAESTSGYASSKNSSSSSSPPSSTRTTTGRETEHVSPGPEEDSIAPEDSISNQPTPNRDNQTGSRSDHVNRRSAEGYRSPFANVDKIAGEKNFKNSGPINPVEKIYTPNVPSTSAKKSEIVPTPKGSQSDARPTRRQQHNGSETPKAPANTTPVPKNTHYHPRGDVAHSGYKMPVNFDIFSVPQGANGQSVHAKQPSPERDSVPHSTQQFVHQKSSESTTQPNPPTQATNEIKYVDFDDKSRGRKVFGKGNNVSFVDFQDERGNQSQLAPQEKPRPFQQAPYPLPTQMDPMWNRNTNSSPDRTDDSLISQEEDDEIMSTPPSSKIEETIRTPTHNSHVDPNHRYTRPWDGSFELIEDEDEIVEEEDDQLEDQASSVYDFENSTMG